MHKLYKIAFISSLAVCSAMSYAEAINEQSTKKASPPTDLGVIDKDRILYWLEKRGELPLNATDEVKQRAFNQYISTRVRNKRNKLPSELSAQMLQNHQATLDRMSSTSAENSKLQLSKVSRASLAPGDVTNTVKVLAIMIDFQDLKHDNHGLTARDTDMFYDEYPKSHYENLLFSPTGYAGPLGQTIESAYQYYQHESGESLNFSGNTFGWVTADNDAEHYGANDNDENDSNVGELVIEAVEKAIAQNQINLSEYDSDNDGVVDHIMIFHSSIGEEAGGGNLGSNAIWSHRFFVFNDNNRPINVEGSTTKIFGYTINPINASTGVVVHEFGHDLGVPDEYDTGNDNIGAPVQGWSVMGSGSWLGSPRGSQPVSFSPYAREYFQTRYGGNWVNQQSITLTDSLNETLIINNATNHDEGINQIKINLPNVPEDFGQPFSGSYQYYSNKGNLLENKLTLNTLTLGSNSTLTMKARWDIEQDYDFITVSVNNQVVAGNHTKLINQYYPSVNNFISGKSTDIAGASSPLGWVDLTFDLSNYANQNVNIEIQYITDRGASGYGFVLDDIEVKSGATTLFSNGAETQSTISLNGFSRITDTIAGANQYYYVQLRDHTITDSALTSINYDPGVLLWYRNEGVENNNVSQHAGEVFIGVVDADQALIRRNGVIRDTEKQLRDAAFSLYDQSFASFDTSFTNTSIFNDKNDYSSPLQPESGINLPKLGLNMEVITQASNSSTASILLTKVDINSLTKTQNGLRINMSVEDTDITNNSNFTWKMGDGTQLSGNSVSHIYTNAGTYDVEVSYSTSGGNKELSQSVTVAPAIEGSIDVSSNNTALSFNANLSGGRGDFIYRWGFGDGEGISTLATGVYNYKNAGSYTVSLTVTDDTGESFVFNESISIDNPLSSSFTSTRNNLITTFTSNVSGGSKPYRYLWDFGDSQTETSSNPSHTYTQSGTYAVKLTVTDADNVTHTVTNNITVNSAVATVSNNGQNTSDSSNSSGGSISWFMLILAGLLLRKRIY